MKLTQITNRLLAASMLLLPSATVVTAHDATPAASVPAMGVQAQLASPAAAATAAQQQMPGMPMKSSGNSLIGHLKNPDYMHTLLNPLPVYGLSMGVLALCIGLFFRNRIAIVAALVVLFVSGFAAWPVYYFGEHAYDRVKAMSDPIGKQWLEEHMARAEKLVYVFYLLAALALAGILAPLKWPRTALPLAVAALVLGAVNLGIGGWISYAGGHVRHAEFRFEPPPAQAKAGHDHEGNEGGMEHGAMAGKSPGGGDAGKMNHGAMPGMQSTGEPKPMPQPAAQTAEQLEASRLQLEASRLQLEASRKQLEAAEGAEKQSPPPNQQPPSPAPSQDEHGHGHP